MRRAGFPSKPQGVKAPSKEPPPTFASACMHVSSSVSRPRFRGESGRDTWWCWARPGDPSSGADALRFTKPLAATAGGASPGDPGSASPFGRASHGAVTWGSQPANPPLLADLSFLALWIPVGCSSGLPHAGTNTHGVSSTFPMGGTHSSWVGPCLSPRERRTCFLASLGACFQEFLKTESDEPAELATRSLQFGEALFPSSEIWNVAKARAARRLACCDH
mmetsp:Transcript_57298/g.129811  ORF Transcript_57298/g.129811 Transcript_57298/m.129811 type:complete len:221 (-) Transcript_57298:1-663(-)